MSKFAFFRQSGWMLIATTAGGGLMALVHNAAGQSKMPPGEYFLFVTFLQVLSQMSIPATALQMTLVQETVASVTSGRIEKLVGAFRALLGGTFALWLVVCGIVFFASEQIIRDYRVSNPALLSVTALLGLASLWSPIMLGILQGRQNFLWLGWVAILNGATRLGAVALIILVLGGYAAGAMTGVLIAMTLALLIAGWQTRDLWRGHAERFQWAPWLKRMIPITLGYGAATYMLTLDVLIVRRYFTGGSSMALGGQPDPDYQNALYGAAGAFGRAIFFFLAPMTTVMFPKIAQSAARSEKNNVLAQAVGATALMGIGVALLCTFFARIPFQIYLAGKYPEALQLVPMFAWCMLPLPLANVLINNLLARERYSVVPWLTAIAVAYYFALSHAAQIKPQRFENVIWTLGGFGVLLLVTCIFFTVWENRRAAPRS